MYKSTKPQMCIIIFLMVARVSLALDCSLEYSDSKCRPPCIKPHRNFKMSKIQVAARASTWYQYCFKEYGIKHWKMDRGSRHWKYTRFEPHPWGRPSITFDMYDYKEFVAYQIWAKQNTLSNGDFFTFIVNDSLKVLNNNLEDHDDPAYHRSLGWCIHNPDPSGIPGYPMIDRRGHCQSSANANQEMIVPIVGFVYLIMGKCII